MQPFSPPWYRRVCLGCSSALPLLQALGGSGWQLGGDKDQLPMQPALGTSEP